jgi:hypothetical protein
MFPLIAYPLEILGFAIKPHVTVSNERFLENVVYVV